MIDNPDIIYEKEIEVEITEFISLKKRKEVWSACLVHEDELILEDRNNNITFTEEVEFHGVNITPNMLVIAKDISKE